MRGGDDWRRSKRKNRMKVGRGRDARRMPRMRSRGRREGKK